MPTRLSDAFWLLWFLGFVGAFLVKEFSSIATRDGGTLSEAIWRLEQFRANQPIEQWSARHVLFLIFMLLIQLVLIWLDGHFLFGMWR